MQKYYLFELEKLELKENSLLDRFRKWFISFSDYMLEFSVDYVEVEISDKHEISFKALLRNNVDAKILVPIGGSMSG